MEIWVVNTQNLKIEIYLKKILKILPEEDCKKVLSYRQIADSMRCAVGRILIRKLAAEKIKNFNIKLNFSEYGKPFFDNKNAPQFNLSHSGNLIILAFDVEKIGVDVEKIISLDLNYFENFLIDEEKFLINNSDDRLKKFYEIWTTLEAFAKFDGRGIGIYDDKNFINYKKNCEFKTFETENYIFTLCAKKIPPNLQPKKIFLDDLIK